MTFEEAYGEVKEEKKKRKIEKMKTRDAALQAKALNDIGSAEEGALGSPSPAASPTG